MCKELEEELKRGDEILKQLVIHTINMGNSDEIEGPVEISAPDGSIQNYTVKVSVRRVDEHG